MSSVWDDLEKRRGTVEQTRENTSRPGRAFAHYTTTGQGYVVEPAVFKFTTAFTTLPLFTFGASLGDEADLPVADDGTVIPPTFCAGVYKWRQNADNFYVGAWCWFVVTVDPLVAASVDGDSTWEMIFSLAWEGIASKDFIRSPNFNLADLETDQ